MLVPAAGTVRHLGTVLRLGDGEPVSYTDGNGCVGEGRWRRDRIERGREWSVAPPPAITIAVAPPRTVDRVRFLVEKLGELGVARLCWLRTRHGSPHLPRAGKVEKWTVGALEQSRGAWLLAVDGPLAWDDLDEPVAVAHPGGEPAEQLERFATIAVGPEGGFAPDEIPGGACRIDLGERVLRVETAAVAVATLQARDLRTTRVRRSG